MLLLSFIVGGNRTWGLSRHHFIVRDNLSNVQLSHVHLPRQPFPGPCAMGSFCCTFQKEISEDDIALKCRARRMGAKLWFWHRRPAWRKLQGQRDWRSGGWTLKGIQPCRTLHQGVLCESHLCRLNAVSKDSVRFIWTRAQKSIVSKDKPGFCWNKRLKNAISLKYAKMSCLFILELNYIILIPMIEKKKIVQTHTH